MCIAVKQSGKFTQKFFRYPTELKRVLRFCRVQRDQGEVYFCAHLLKRKKRIKDYAVDSIHTLWADVDNSSLGTINPPPTLTVRSSDGRHHLYWCLESPVSPQEAESLCRLIAQDIRADLSGWDLTQLLRVPGTINHKRQGQKVSLIQSQKVTYAPSVFSTKIEREDEEPSQPDQRSDHVSITRVPVAHLKISPEIKSLIYRHLERGQRSERDQRVIVALLSAGYDESVVRGLFTNSVLGISSRYFSSGGGDRYLTLSIKKAQQYLAAHPPVVVSANGHGPKYELLHLDDFTLKYAIEPEWLIQDIWFEANFGLMAGLPKSYKTFLGLDMAVCIASGRPYLGQFEVIDRGPVILLQKEQSAGSLVQRIESFKAVHGLVRVIKNGTGYVLEWDRIPVHVVPARSGFMLTNDEDFEKLRKDIEAIGPKMVLMDPLFRLFIGLDEYRGSDINRIVDPLDQITEEYGTSICIVHHMAKSGQGKLSGRNMYGSVMLWAAQESGMYIEDVHDKPWNIKIEREHKDASLPPLYLYFDGQSYQFMVLDETEEEPDPSEFKAPRAKL